jgi:hypothetical protein
LIQLGDIGPDQVIWRYLPFNRFASLVALSALWFSKLQNFVDQEEGITPDVTRAELKRQHLEMEEWFPDEERKRQVRRFVEDNEESGRELIVANCWFMAERESQNMWDAFGNGDEGVVVKSTVGALVRSLAMSHDKWWFGKVTYIDPSTHNAMDAYEGSQAHLRAFLKNACYAHENELRLATMNYVAPGCLNPDGSPPNERQRAGYVYSANRPGIYVTVNLTALITELRTSPNASDSQREKIERLLSKTGCAAPVRSSELSVTYP